MENRLHNTVQQAAGLAAILISCLVLLACPTGVKISDLQQNPGKYAGKEVSISGTVTESFGLMGNGAYQLNDGSGSIWVISEGYGVPGKGAKVGVTGTVTEGASFGGRSLGTALRQTQRTKS